MYCAYLGRDHDLDECYGCKLGSPCQGIPSNLISQARQPAQLAGLGGDGTAREDQTRSDRVQPAQGGFNNA